MLQFQNNSGSAYDDDFPNHTSDANSSNYIFPETNNFNEEQWISLLFLISDTQTWIDELQLNLLYQLPVRNKRKLFRKSYYLTASALAHILERHYFKISRYPNAGKFTVPVSGIAAYIRDAFAEPASPITNSCNLQKIMDVKQVIGFDKYGKSTSIITVVSDAGGKIITAFPGSLNE